MINALRAEFEAIDAVIAVDCCENNVAAVIDSRIDPTKILILKIDVFYAHLLKMKLITSMEMPKSIDCLIIQYCDNNKYHVYLVELKNVEKATLLERKDIVSKFETVLKDFMSNRFREYFYNTEYYLDLRLILIAGSIKNNKMRNFKIDFLQTLPPFYFGNKRYAIEHNEPNPLINPC